MQRRPVRSASGTVVERAALPTPCLSQRILDLQAEADAEPEAIGRLYDKLFLKHFGFPSPRRASTRANIAFGRVFAWCTRHGVRIADYIAANMLLLKPRLGRHTFQPLMLSGERAERRYNGVLGRANRRFQSGSMRVFDDRETWLGRLRAAVCVSEQDVAEVYVEVNLAGEELSWADAAGMVETTDEWRQFQRRGLAFHDLIVRYGIVAAEREALLASLRAAWAVAERLEHGLPDKIAYHRFSWPAFVRLLRYLGFAPKRTEQVLVPLCVGGSQWGNW